jgi:hypothetical protein
MRSSNALVITLEIEALARLRFTLDSAVAVSPIRNAVVLTADAMRNQSDQSPLRVHAWPSGLIRSPLATRLLPTPERRSLLTPPASRPSRWPQQRLRGRGGGWLATRRVARAEGAGCAAVQDIARQLKL